LVKDNTKLNAKELGRPVGVSKQVILARLKK
jgi:hypothetical protein